MISYGIPTKYLGRQYRSRLEARWAALFTRLGWQFEYEPYDLRGWIPDFAIYGADEILVEVKPHHTLEQFNVAKIAQAMADTDKADKEVLLLGSTLFKSRVFGANHVCPYCIIANDDKAAAIGWLGEVYDDSTSRNFELAILNCYDGFGFFHEYGCYADRITGLYDGDHFLNPSCYASALAYWNEAGNETQWARITERAS